MKLSRQLIFPDGSVQQAAAAINLPTGITALGDFEKSLNLYRPPGVTTTRFNARMGQSAAGTGRTKFGQLGASMTAGYNGAASVRSIVDVGTLFAASVEGMGYPVAEPAFVFDDFIAYETRDSLTGTWSHSTQPSAAVYAIAPNGATATFPCKRVTDSCYIDASAIGGNFTVAIDGKALTAANFPGVTVTTSHCTWTNTTGAMTMDGTSNPATITITGLAKTAHTLLWTATSASAVLFMVDFYLSTGISIANFGSSSSRSANWNDTTNWYNLLSNVLRWAPDVVIFGDDIAANDYINGVSLATSYANMAAIITTLQAAGIEVILMTPPPFLDLSSIPPVIGFWQNFYTLADTFGCLLIDNNYRWVSRAKAFANGMYGADNFHPSNGGYEDLGRSLFAAMGVNNLGKPTSPVTTFTPQAGASNILLPFTNIASAAAAAPAQNAACYLPVYVAAPLPITALACNVSTAAVGGTAPIARLSLSYDNGNGSGPGQVIVEGAATAITSTGIKTLASVRTLAPGLYWVGFAFQYTVVPTTLPQFTSMNTVLPLPGPSMTSINYRCLLLAGVSGVFPSYPAATPNTQQAPVVGLVAA